MHEDVSGGGDGRHFQLARAGAPVQGFDVLQHVLDLDALGFHLARGERVEHEGVVGIRAVADTDQHRVSS
jgi:hypothetical protein